jgi:hypothetical protein
MCRCIALLFIVGYFLRQLSCCFNERTPNNTLRANRLLVACPYPQRPRLRPRARVQQSGLALVLVLEAHRDPMGPDLVRPLRLTCFVGPPVSSQPIPPSKTNPGLSRAVPSGQRLPGWSLWSADLAYKSETIFRTSKYSDNTIQPGMSVTSSFCYRYKKQVRWHESCLNDGPTIS